MHSKTSPDHPGHPGHCQALKDWLARNLVQEVPRDMAICEFDCSKLNCCREEFENCQRRLSGRSLGMPGEPAPRKAG